MNAEAMLQLRSDISQFALGFAVVANVRPHQETNGIAQRHQESDARDIEYAFRARRVGRKIGGSDRNDENLL